MRSFRYPILSTDSPKKWDNRKKERVMLYIYIIYIRCRIHVNRTKLPKENH
jgi:hypothetical protein